MDNDFLTAKNTKIYAKDAKKTEARGEFSTLRWEQIPLRELSGRIAYALR
jgi:hypothetical protein